MSDWGAFVWAWVTAVVLLAPYVVYAMHRDRAARQAGGASERQEGCIGSTAALLFDILYYALACLVILPITLARRLLRRGPRTTAPEPQVAATPPQPPTNASAQRSALREQLVHLAASEPEPTTPVDATALCYAPACPPERAEYVCPVCGERTVLTDSRAAFAAWILPTLRRQVAEIPRLAVQLAERGMCAHCYPRGGEAQCDLLVCFEGEARPRQTRAVSSQDLLILTEFLQGSLVHAGAYGGTTPLKHHLARLQELLGVELPKGDRAP